MYPVMLNVKGKKCAVIGGGIVALRKAKKLTESGADVTAIAPEFTAGFDGIKQIRKRYEAADIDGCFLVIAASNDADVNRAAAHDARSKNILVSLADDADNSDFILPASRSEGDFTVAVSTNGSFPLLAKKLCEKLSGNVKFYASILPVLEKYRQKIISESGNTELFEYMISDEMIEIAKTDIALFESKIEKLL